VLGERERKCMVSSSSYDSSPIGIGSPLGSHFTLVSSLKVLSSNTITLGVMAAAYEFWREA
jgi:hypothetical protein